MNDALPSLVHGRDGVARCWWAGPDADYQLYHDTEWGVPVRDEQGLFERISLEAFQSGLSWLTILRRRSGFRRAFADFSPAVVAEYTPSDVTRLLQDPGIIRNKAKVLATIANARAVLGLRAHGGLADFFWSFAPAAPAGSIDRAAVPAKTAESTALAKALKSAGFSFVGPTTAYAAMQACGLVNDHVQGCQSRP